MARILHRDFPNLVYIISIGMDLDDKHHNDKYQPSYPPPNNMALIRLVPGKPERAITGNLE